MARSEAPDDPRQYSRVANDLPRNRKVIGTGNIAIAIAAHVAAITYCGDSLTDGFFSPDYILRSIDGPADFAIVMARQRLWHLPSHDCDRCPQPGPGEAVVHDYLRHNRSAAEVLALTEKRRESGRRGAESRWGGSSKPPPPGKPPRGDVASAMASAMANGSQVDGRAEQSRAESVTGPYVPNGRNARDLGEPPNNEQAGPAERILTDWRSSLRSPVQPKIMEQVGEAVVAALRARISEAHVAEGIQVWQARGNLGPGMLATLIHEVSQRKPSTDLVVDDRSRSPTLRLVGQPDRRPSTTDARVGGNLDLVAELRAEREARNGTG